MDADEMLSALKKAYADIILNMSKDAANRVLASERKAAMYQHELKVSKQESFRLLIRLKEMMDSKIIEGEKTSLNQEKKIDELGSQLEEAEDIVRDLREKLSIVNDELEKVKDNSRPVNETDTGISGKVTVENHVYSYQSSASLSPKSHDPSVIASSATILHPTQTNECSKCYTDNVDNSFAGYQDLSSRNVSCQESVLYRKGCSQLIRACERHLLDKDLPMSWEKYEVRDEKNGKEQVEGGGRCRALDSDSETLNELRNKQLTGVSIKRVKPFLQKRKRSKRKMKTVVSMSKKQSDIFCKLDRLSELSSRKNLIAINNRHFSDNPLKQLSRSLPDKFESSNLMECPEVAGRDKFKLDEDEGLIKDMLPSINGTEVLEGLLSTNSKMEVENVDVPLNISYNTTGLPKESRGERVIKFTFQRKRKRKTLCKAGINVSLATEKRNEDKLNVDQDLELSKPNMDTTRLKDSKSGSILESSRDNRRLAQVARQLISLSEKKWWD